MNEHCSEPDSVRQMLADRTRKVHLVLHRHPWISLLGSSALTVDQYGAILRAYHHFFAHVDTTAAEHALASSLSLEPARDRLKADIDSLALPADADTMPPVELCLSSSRQVLGAFYVLHGSSFGASVLNRNVRAVLPAVPRHFLGARSDRACWSQLIQELERHREDDLARRDILQGAMATFEQFGEYVTRLCESIFPPPLQIHSVINKKAVNHHETARPQPRSNS